jgi:hypothetical protein
MCPHAGTLAAWQGDGQTAGADMSVLSVVTEDDGVCV